MTAEIWTAIAIGIIGLINQWAVAGWTNWRSRPTVSPKANHEKARVVRQPRLSKNRFVKIISGLIGSAVPVGLLVFAMTRPGPVSRWTVLSIAMGVGWLMVQFAIAGAVYISVRAWSSLNRQP